MFALAAALLVSPAVNLQPPGKSSAQWVPPDTIMTEDVVFPQPGGFGGAGFGGELGDAFHFETGVTRGDAAPETGESFVQGTRVLVLISPDGSKVWGWSPASGTLSPLPVDVPEDERGEVRPVVSADVAMLTVGGVAYAYGGSSGTWGSHPIGDRPDAAPVVGTSVAAIRTADGVFAYSGVTGTGGLHPLEPGEAAVGPVVGQDYVQVRSPQGFGMFSATTGTWGSVRYDAPAGDDAAGDDAAGDDPAGDDPAGDDPATE